MVEQSKKTTGMVFIPDSRFMMGSEGTTRSDDEKPRHEVRVKSFYIDKHEVTNADYVAVMKGKKSPSPEGFDGPNQPVVNVNWNEADACCNAQGKRLATEAEWEKAAIGLSKGYDQSIECGTPSGKCSNEREVVYNAGHTADVCSKGEMGYGTCDMSGNAGEWVADWYDSDYYKNSPSENPTGPFSGEYRVIRGGSWYGNGGSGGGLRATDRSDGPPGLRDGDIVVGFRCALSPEDLNKDLKK